MIVIDSSCNSQPFFSSLIPLKRNIEQSTGHGPDCSACTLHFFVSDVSLHKFNVVAYGG